MRPLVPSVLSDTLDTFRPRTSALSATQFRQHKYSVYEISSGNEFSVPEMAQGGYNITNMREANKRVFDGANGVSPTFTNDKVRESYTATDFKQQGIAANQTRAFGYSISHMKDCGFTTGEFHATGFDIGDIRGVGFTPINYNHGGYTAAAVYSIGFHSCSHFKGGAYEASVVRPLGPEAFKIGDFHSAGYSVREVRAAGFTAGDCKSTSYTVSQIRYGGFNLRSCKDSAKFTVREALSVAFPPHHLRGVGYEPAEWRSCSPPCTARVCRNAGYYAAQVVDGGYSIAECREAAYLASEVLRGEDVTLASLRDGGYSPRQSRQANFTFRALKNVGYTATEFIRSALSPPLFAQVLIA